jgi:hypothetical protein
MRFHPVARFAVMLLGAAVPLVSHAQFQAPTPEELKMVSDPKAPGADAVYLYREETEDDPHHFRTVYARIKVLTEKGNDLATVHVTYSRNFVFHAMGNNSSRSSSAAESHFDAPDPNHAGEDQPWDVDSYAGHVEVSAIEGRTIHPDGTIVPLAATAADLLKLKAGGSQINETTFNMPSVEVGSILEYRYQVRYDRFLSAPEWQIQQPYFVHKAHYLYTPAEQFLPERTKGGMGMSSSMIKGGHDDIMTDVRATSVLPPGKTVKQDPLGRYAVDLSDIPPIPNEPYSPALAAQIYQINFYYIYTPDQKSYWQKEMEYWSKDLNRYIAPTGLIQSTVSEAVAGSDTALDKAKKLYALVQKLENTDVLHGESAAGDNSSIPRGNVEAILENKRGDGNQIAYLYLALARAAGLNARPERIASRNHRIFSPQFLSISQLDSVLIGITLDGKELLIDAGTKMAPFQTLNWPHAGAGGLAMASSGKAEIVVTPLQLNTDNTVTRVGSLNISAQGTVSGTLKVGFIGQPALQLRQLALRAGVNAAKEQVDKILAAQVPAGIEAHVDHIAFLDDSSKQLVAVVPVTGSLGTRTGNRLILPRLFFESREANPFPASEARTLPVDMHYASQEQEQITYVYPSGYSLEGKPEDAAMKWEDNAAYQLKSKTAATSITSARILARGFTFLDAKDYSPLHDFYQKIVVADQQQLVLTPAQVSMSQ